MVVWTTEIEALVAALVHLRAGLLEQQMLETFLGFAMHLCCTVDGADACLMGLLDGCPAAAEMLHSCSGTAWQIGWLR